ncbi:hypothetical protein R1sor_007869 [Riccia sorocarpa]|uniref:U-box domain-containing protein n=1 Tax=Riccia sorocarpa TaxID=122646 RepID=A0ABD3HRR6_9MARC
MAELMVLSAVAEVTKRLVISLLEVRAAKQDNKKITREINEFVSDLDKNVALLKCKLPPNVSGGALDSLLRKLEEAHTFVQSRQDQNFFKSMWTAKQTTEKLNSQRRNLDSAFQLALFFTTLDVALEANKKIDDFQLKIQKISEDHSDNSTYARGEMQNILALLMQGVHKTDPRLQSIITTVQSLPQNTETEKFFADVLANISSQVGISENEGSTITTEGDDDDEFCDPLTCNRMCDPVKGTDGLTYDRWTIIDNDLTESPFKRNKGKPFSIVCDDINVRARLFSRFPVTEALFHERRASYRREALKLAHEGQDADALLMLENVLEWDYEDAECQRLREVISRRIHQEKASSGSHLQGLGQFPKEEHHKSKSFEAVSSEKYQSSLKQRANEERVEGTGVVQKLKDIVGLLSRETSTTTLLKAAMSFANLAQAPENKLSMAIYPGALEKLVDENVTKIAACPNTIGRVVDLLSKDIPVAVQLEAARALESMVAVMPFGNLTEGREWLVELAEYPGALPILIDLLEQGTPEFLQIAAAFTIVKLSFWAFANLACADENKSMLASFPEALEKLVTLFGSGVNSRLQYCAAVAFHNLSVADENKVLMAGFPNAIERLVGLLAPDVEERVQRMCLRESKSHAMMAFANLAIPNEEQETPSRVSRSVGEAGGFAFPWGSRNCSRCNAARAFANLASAQKNKTLMASYPGAKDKLVALLCDPAASENAKSDSRYALSRLSGSKWGSWFTR